MSRFFKSAAFPILIVVVLAFFAQKLISPGAREHVPNYSEFTTQVSSGPPLFVLFGGANEPDAGYRRYLENRLRGELGLEGVPIRLRFRPRTRVRKRSRGL